MDRTGWLLAGGYAYKEILTNIIIKTRTVTLFPNIRIIITFMSQLSEISINIQITDWILLLLLLRRYALCGISVIYDN